MVEPSSPHKSSKTSQENGEYNTELHHPQMHSLIFCTDYQEQSHQGHGRGRGPAPSNPLIHHDTLKPQSTLTSRVTEL